MAFNGLTQYWESNLTCPSCKGEIKILEPSIQCKNCHSTYSINDGIPYFVDDELSEHQKSELESLLKRLPRIRAIKDFYNQNEKLYKWVLEWINDRTINENTKMICIGGGYADDLP
ncbi:unnamed protein product, partial [marine sediment metagenome]